MQLEGEITIADWHPTSNGRLFLEGLGLVGRQEKERLESVKISSKIIVSRKACFLCVLHFGLFL